MTVPVRFLNIIVWIYALAVFVHCDSSSLRDASVALETTDVLFVDSLSSHTSSCGTRASPCSPAVLSVLPSVLANSTATRLELLFLPGLYDDVSIAISRSGSEPSQYTVVFVNGDSSNSILTLRNASFDFSGTFNVTIGAFTFIDPHVTVRDRALAHFQSCKFVGEMPAPASYYPYMSFVNVTDADASFDSCVVSGSVVHLSGSVIDATSSYHASSLSLIGCVFDALHLATHSSIVRGGTEGGSLAVTLNDCTVRDASSVVANSAVGILHVSGPSTALSITNLYVRNLTLNRPFMDIERAASCNVSNMTASLIEVNRNFLIEVNRNFGHLVRVRDGGALALRNSSFHGVRTAYGNYIFYGSAISVVEASTATVYGVTFTNMEAREGAVLSVSSGATVTMKHTVMQQVEGVEGGAVSVRGARVLLDNVTVNVSSTSSSGGVLKLASGAVVNATDMVIFSASTSRQGAFATIERSSLNVRRLALHGCKVTLSARGTAIFASNSRVDMDEVFIAHCEATRYQSSGLFSCSLSEFRVRNSVFTNNSCVQAGVIDMWGDSVGEFVNVSLRHQSTVEAAGLAHVHGSSTLLLNRCVIEDVGVGAAGGAILAQDDAVVSIHDSSFYRVSAAGGGGIASLLHHATLNMTGCRAEDMSASQGGAILAQSSSDGTPVTVHLSNSSFNRCSVSGTGGVMHMGVRVRASLLQCTFHDARADRGGVMYAQAGAVAHLDSCSFVSNAARIGGGVYADGTGTSVHLSSSRSRGDSAATSAGFLFAAGGATVYAEACQFEGSHGTANGGAFFIGEQSRLSLYDVDFVNCSTLSSGGAIAISRSDLDVSRVRATSCRAEIHGGFIHAEADANVNISQAQLQSLHAGATGVGLSIYRATVSMRNVTSRNCSGGSGGLFFAMLSNVSASHIVVESTSVDSGSIAVGLLSALSLHELHASDCLSTKGGFMMTSSRFDITESSIRSNYAQQGTILFSTNSTGTVRRFTSAMSGALRTGLIYLWDSSDVTLDAVNITGSTVRSVLVLPFMISCSTSTFHLIHSYVVDNSMMFLDASRCVSTITNTTLQYRRPDQVRREVSPSWQIVLLGGSFQAVDITARVWSGVVDSLCDSSGVFPSIHLSNSSFVGGTVSMFRYGPDALSSATSLNALETVRTAAGAALTYMFHAGGCTFEGFSTASQVSAGAVLLVETTNDVRAESGLSSLLDVTFHRCTFTNMTVRTHGGIVSIETSALMNVSLSMSHCVASHCSAGDAGGFLHAGGNTTCSLVESTVYGATSPRGGIFELRGHSKLTVSNVVLHVSSDISRGAVMFSGEMSSSRLDSVRVVRDAGPALVSTSSSRLRRSKDLSYTDARQNELLLLGQIAWLDDNASISTSNVTFDVIYSSGTGAPFTAPPSRFLIEGIVFYAPALPIAPPSLVPAVVSIVPEAIAKLTPFHVPILPDDQLIRAFSDGEVRQFLDSTVGAAAFREAVSPAVMPLIALHPSQEQPAFVPLLALSPGAWQLRTASPVLVPFVNAISVPALSPSQIPLLSPNQVSSVVANSVPNVSPGQTPLLTATQLPAVVPMNSQFFSPEQVPILPPRLLVSLAPRSVPATSMSQMALLNPHQLDSLYPIAIPALPPARLPILAPHALSSISTHQFNDLPPQELRAIAPLVPPSFVPSLSPAVQLEAGLLSTSSHSPSWYLLRIMLPLVLGAFIIGSIVFGWIFLHRFWRRWKLQQERIDVFRLRHAEMLLHKKAFSIEDAIRIRSARLVRQAILTEIVGHASGDPEVQCPRKSLQSWLDVLGGYSRFLTDGIRLMQSEMIQFWKVPLPIIPHLMITIRETIGGDDTPSGEMINGTPSAPPHSINSAANMILNARGSDSLCAIIDSMCSGCHPGGASSPPSSGTIGITPWTSSVAWLVTTVQILRTLTPLSSPPMGPGLVHTSMSASIQSGSSSPVAPPGTGSFGMLLHADDSDDYSARATDDTRTVAQWAHDLVVYAVGEVQPMSEAFRGNLTVEPENAGGTKVPVPEQAHTHSPHPPQPPPSHPAPVHSHATSPSPPPHSPTQAPCLPTLHEHEGMGHDVTLSDIPFGGALPIPSHPASPASDLAGEAGTTAHSYSEQLHPQQPPDPPCHGFRMVRNHRFDDGIAESRNISKRAHIATGYEATRSFYPLGYHPWLSAPAWIWAALDPSRFPSWARLFLLTSAVDCATRTASTKDDELFGELDWHQVMVVHLYTAEIRVPPCDAEGLLNYSFVEGDSWPHQLYALCNSAMRSRNPALVSEWRPFIFFLDIALRTLLPESSSVVYRGIDIPYNPAVYAPGSRVIWDGFSSTSSSEKVAQQFAGLTVDSTPVVDPNGDTTGNYVTGWFDDDAFRESARALARRISRETPRDAVGKFVTNTTFLPPAAGTSPNSAGIQGTSDLELLQQYPWYQQINSHCGESNQFTATKLEVPWDLLPALLRNIRVRLVINEEAIPDVNLGLVHVSIQLNGQIPDVQRIHFPREGNRDEREPPIQNVDAWKSISPKKCSKKMKSSTGKYPWNYTVTVDIVFGSVKPGTVFIIHSSNCRNVSRYSAIPAESERLLPPNSCLVVREALTAEQREFLGISNVQVLILDHVAEISDAIDSSLLQYASRMELSRIHDHAHTEVALIDAQITTLKESAKVSQALELYRKHRLEQLREAWSDMIHVQERAKQVLRMRDEASADLTGGNKIHPDRDDVPV